MSQLDVQPGPDGLLRASLAEEWSIAEAADLAARLEAACPSDTPWCLEASELAHADLAIWQVLYRHARRASAFQLAGPAPALDELSAALALPPPASWATLSTSDA
ncbi:MAG: hypothetical protein ACLFU2_00155 [Opitutales bacterium]